ncbi:MAG: tRNA (uridine(54)-C5)-methyltransferase TrmA [Gammaproteobacteria bacterium]|nr:tRNA (uridine(54)-C5)-methyltransferase TrmA [Gammaproteobacteria bacterium]
MAIETAVVEHYSQQLANKTSRLKQGFAELGDWASEGDLTVFESAPEHYRMRAEFRLWHTDDDLFYAMFPKGQKFNPIKIESFQPGSIRINELMLPLLEAIKESSSLRLKLFQMDFLTSQTGEAVVSMLYHRQLDAQWEDAANVIAKQFDIKVVGRARKQKLVIGGDHIMETLQVGGRAYHYQQVENAFTQPNAGINEQMLAWACAQGIQHKPTTKPDLLELYCGNGNFTIPLAGHYRQVMATEIAKSSVNSAQFNLQVNDVDNVVIARLSSEEMTAALNGVRAFRRLRDIDLQEYEFGTVLVDPPRAGLDEGTLNLVQQFDCIIYISCNPVTLMANLQHLKQTHRLQAKAMFDQFPYTDHVETGVVLTRI